MRIDVITIFPGYLAPLHESLIGQAIEAGIIDLAVHDLRDWTTDRHRTVDDTPYGGGPGMVMRPDVWGRALDTVIGDGGQGYDDGSGPGTLLVVPTPSGVPFDQRLAARWARADHLIIACGRYEGIDQRVVEEAARRVPVREVSIGDVVLAGGEVAALVIIEAVGRLLPGVLGNVASAADDSFAVGTGGLLEAPVYTRPADYRGYRVPEALLSGDHARIARYRRDESLRRTARHRPDLLARLTAADCDERDLEILLELGVDPPAGLAERVSAERRARADRRRRRSRPTP